MTVKTKERQAVKALCNMCSKRCGMNVYVEEGKITEVAGMEEHPFYPLCVKAEGITQWIYSPERVTTPLLKVKGKWKEVSWDQALDFVADRLQRIKEKYGAQALVTWAGFAASGGGFDVRSVIRRFCDVYGTPNYTTGSSHCFWAKNIGHSMVLGHKTILSAGLRQANCIVTWGMNPAQSRHTAAVAITAARRRRAKLIVVDPRRVSGAKAADIHAQLRPGTDCALALGMLNVIIGEELFDESFVAEWTVGFDHLAEHVREYTPERVAEITWVPAGTIREMARLYATTKPATILQGVSIDHSTSGVDTSRALATLIAITGNFDIRGGNSAIPRLKLDNLAVPGAVSYDEAVGADYPLFTKVVGHPTVMPVPNAILSGQPYPVKAMIVQGGNPALTWPDSNKLMKALAKLDLLVVIDLFLTDTAKMAHVFLPAASFLERRFLRDYSSDGLPMVARSEAVIEPLGQSMEDWRIWAELGKRLGYGKHFPWESADDLFRTLLKPSGITVEELKENPAGVIYGKAEEKAYLKKGFDTSSGKAELHSSLMEQHGYAPLPTYSEPPESPLSTPELAREYPLILVSGPRMSVYSHSQHRNVPVLRQRMPEPLIEIHPETASKLGIAAGDMVNVETVRGKIELKTKLTEDIDRRVVSIMHGWSEANANLLTDDDGRDPVSAYPSFKALLCRVTKK